MQNDAEKYAKPTGVAGTSGKTALNKTIKIYRLTVSTTDRDSDIKTIPCPLRSR